MTSKTNTAVRYLAGAVCALGMASSGWSAPVLEYHFNDPARIDAFRQAACKENEVIAAANPLAAERKAVTIRPTLIGKLNANVPLPEGFTKGVVSFWFYDDAFDAMPNGSPGSTGWFIGGKYDKGGKLVNGGFGLANNRSRAEWMLDLEGTTSLFGLKRKAGWIKFDIVFDPAAANGAPTVYADGVPVLRLPVEGYQPSSLSFRPFWGSDDITIADIVVDDDPASFRPAVVQNIAAGDEANNVVVTAGEPLKLSLGLDPKGASAPRGVIELEFLDLQEKSVAKVKTDIDWSAQKEPRLTVAVPSLPSSRHYWVFARYFDEGKSEAASRTLGKINVQYLADSKPQSFRGKIELARSWDFVPESKLDAPSLPASWEGAAKVRKLWYSFSNRNFKDTMAGWYHRTIDIPANWAGRRILLQIEQPQNVARAFVNGKPAGEVIWPGGDIDLTGKVQPGSKAELVIYVDAEAPPELANAVVAAMGSLNALPAWFRSDTRGLCGEVSLRSQPVGARIESVSITPRVAQKTLALEFIAEGLVPGTTYSIEGSASKGGKAVKPFKSAEFKAATARAALKMEVPWADVELWDLGKPNLYDLNASLISKGQALDAVMPERFGFREVTFDGRLVKINGNPANMLMPMPTQLMSNFGMAECMRRNHQTYLSNNHFNYYSAAGSEAAEHADEHFDLCDEAGFGADLGMSNISIRKTLVNFYAAKGGSLLDDKTYWASLERVLKRGVQRYGNRPGLFFFLGGGNGGQLEMGGMMNPMKQDGMWVKNFDDRPMMRQLYEVERRAQALIRKADPRKPIIAQDGGNFNDAVHLTHYAGFWNIQEFIESDEYWIKYGVKPYMITEQSAPWDTDWTTGARLGHNSPSRYPTIAERTAMTKGDAAYRRAQVDQDEVTQFEERCALIRRKDPKSRDTMQPPLGPLYAFQRSPQAASHYYTINYERCREQWLNWRADGLGLLCDWSPTMAGKPQATREAWAPLTGFIAGNAVRRTDKTHIYRPGEFVDRQFIILNNRRDPARTECRWVVALDGRDIASGTSAVELTPGGQATVPIRAEVPRDNADRSGAIRAELLEDGKKIAGDSVAIQVLAARPPAAPASRIALIDPEGVTAETLTRQGVPFRKVAFNADLAPYDVVIFGRKAFSYESKLMAHPVDISLLMGAGKRVVVMEQEEDVLRGRFKFRTEGVSPRYMFARIAGHPVTAGLSDDVLNHWRGAATLTDGYEAARSQALESEATGARNFIIWNDGKEHPRQMKWGNSHNVATAVINKPERGNFRALIDCEYNLGYATLLEFENGAGRILFCQADLSGRTASDPAAERLLSNLIGYIDKARPVAWSQGIAYLGGARGADLLSRLQAAFRPVQSPDQAKPGEILVLGDGITPASLGVWKMAVARFVGNGGTCLSLPRGKDEWNWLPFAVGVKDALIDSTLVDKPSRPILAGLSNGDLYYPGRIPVVALEKLPAGSFQLDTGIFGEVPYGKGRYLLCQVSPESFDVAAKFYLEESRQRSYQLYHVVLNNLGVPMKAPEFMEPVIIEGGSEKRPNLDLTAAGTWMGLSGGQDDQSIPPENDPRWKPVKVPGYVNDQRPEWDNTKTHIFWYRFRFNLEKLPDSAKPSRLQIAAIDDEDDVIFNGTHIGHTGRDTNTNDWMQAPRYYNIAPELFRKGANEIVVRVVNLDGKCGITTAPVRILWGEAEKTKAETSLIALANLPPVDLAGPWWRVIAGEANEVTQPSPGDKRWRQKQVPGSVVETEERYAWCVRDMPIKEIPQGARPVLVIGAVDDEDEVSINGQVIGHTGKDTNPKDWYSAQRAYPIPDGVLKSGTNRIIIRVHNLAPGPGSITGPVQIFWIPPDEAVKLRLSVAPYLFEVDRLSDPYWWCGGW